MVVLRLTRIGKKKQAQYRVVVADSKRFVNSKFISIVGWYNPHTKESELKKEEIMTWLAKGAQPSNTVAKLLTANGVKLPDWVKITEKNRKPKKEAVAKPEKVEKPAEEDVILNDVKEPESEVLDSSVEPQNDEVVTTEAPAEEAEATETEEAETTEEETEKNPE